MEDFYIDFRFVEIEYELIALKEYMRMTEEQLPRLKEREQERLQSEIESLPDEEEVSIAYQQHYDLIDHVLPRFFRGPILVTLWAIYESAINEVASYIKEKQDCQLKMRDIKGDVFECAQKYFDGVLKFPLGMDEQTFHKLKMLYLLRNALAHGNGRKDVVNKESWSKIEALQKKRIGVVIYNNNLVFTSQFVMETFEIASEFLRDLVRRTRNSYTS